MKRRQMVGTLLTGAIFSFEVSAQVSQRAQQLRNRRACEEDLPECKPHIREQLEAEERRVDIGLGILGLATVAASVLLVRRNFLQSTGNDVRQPDKRLTPHASDSKKNRAD